MSMYPENMFFTSESVCEGHVDKFCDQISDGILDGCLRHDPMSRVACNTYVTMGLLLVGGEITTHALFDISFFMPPVKSTKDLDKQFFTK